MTRAAATGFGLGDRRSRRDALLLVLGGSLVAGGGAYLGARASGALAQPSREQDEEILRVALSLEHLQAAFYAEAESRGALPGELAVFARTVGAQERAHVEHLRRNLGAAAPDEPDFEFGEATGGEEGFRAAALALEEATVRFYIGQGANLTVRAVGAVAPLVSVEARHAAWIRAIGPENPAPAAADPALTVDQVRARLAVAGFELPE